MVAQHRARHPLLGIAAVTEVAEREDADRQTRRFERKTLGRLLEEGREQTAANDRRPALLFEGESADRFSAPALSFSGEPPLEQTHQWTGRARSQQLERCQSDVEIAVDEHTMLEGRIDPGIVHMLQLIDDVLANVRRGIGFEQDEEKVEGAEGVFLGKLFHEVRALVLIRFCEDRAPPLTQRLRKLRYSSIVGGTNYLAGCRLRFRQRRPAGHEHGRQQEDCVHHSSCRCCLTG